MNLETPPHAFLYFEPLTFSEAQIRIQSTDITLQHTTVMAIYESWLSRFYKKSHSFYRAQLHNYQRAIEREFYRRHNILEGDTLCGYYDEWEEWASSTGLDARMEDSNLRMKRLELHMKELDKTSKNRKELLLEHSPEFIADISFGLSEIWFNKATNSPERKRLCVREYSYEDYLSTQDWKKVRAAIILIYGARCQAQECYDLLESWYGDEFDLNVHHISYANVGQERFSELTLLCRRHHEAEHSD